MVDLLDHVDRHDHDVVLEAEQRLGIVQQNVGVEDEVLLQRDLPNGISCVSRGNRCAGALAPVSTSLETGAAVGRGFLPEDARSSLPSAAGGPWLRSRGLARRWWCSSIIGSS